MGSDVVNQIFKNLNNWKNLPKYQLERRLDIFLTPFLKNVIETNLTIQLDDLIIPEFPVNVNLVNPFDISKKEYKTENANKNYCFELVKSLKIKQQSFNVDYLMFSSDKKVAYFIELKSDNSSYNDEQKTRMLIARDYYTFNELQIGLKEIWNRTKRKEKYDYLLKLLLGNTIIETGINGNYNFIAEKIEIIYLIPNSPEIINTEENIKFITFNKISESIQSDDIIAMHLKDLIDNIYKQYSSK